MYTNGNTYFTCDLTEPVHCCDWCHYYYSGTEDGECKYCDKKYCNGWSTICEEPDVYCDDQETGWFSISGPCPPDYSKRAGPEPTDGYGQSVYWHLPKDKEAAFSADLYLGVGIKQEDIKLDDVENYHLCTPAIPDDCKYFGWDYGIHVPHGYDVGDVIKPKDLVEQAYGNLKDIVKDLPTAVGQLKDGSFEVSASDLADALTLPVYIIEEAVNNIKEILDTIEELEEEKRKNIILLFLTALFFFVPIVGEIASAVASLGTIGRVISMLGAVGNDPLAIFALVLAPLSIFDIAKMTKTAKIARQMKGEDIAKLGKKVEAKLHLVSEVNKVCKLSKWTVFLEGALPMSGLNAEPVWSRSL